MKYFTFQQNHFRSLIFLVEIMYVRSIGMEEFRMAHHIMVNENKKYIVAILLEPLDVDALPQDLRMYLRTYTYIDATKIPRDMTRYVRSYR